MRYLADILTFSRIILAIILFMLSFTRIEIATGFLIFIIGELTDAFDGTCASRWPFPKNKTPKYRKYAAKYDMLADALIAFSMIIFFTFRVDFVAGLIIFLTYSVIALIIEYAVYGKLLGHPDDCTKNSLMRKNFKKAKKIIMARRMFYLFLIALVATWTLYASGWGLAAKITITVIAVIISIILWFFLSQRRHHISRDAVDIEKKLEH
ncbi:CDP-alcohol phosphatidyltransferase family protein [Candidatus Saccharibacteria bacterium]|nr:CDP-alcohol phosphatidyltransferase family protein [Candidatus Saccharibacteria bacterium]